MTKCLRPSLCDGPGGDPHAICKVCAAPCSCAKGRPCKEAKRLWFAVEKVLKEPWAYGKMITAEREVFRFAYQPYRDHVLAARKKSP